MNLAISKTAAEAFLTLTFVCVVNAQGLRAYLMSRMVG
jgi:hypothetical protein